MGYPSQAELVAADPLLPWIDDHFLRPDPYAFGELTFRPVITQVTKELDVDPNGIYCIGSGAIGLSLNPEKVTGGQLRRFTESSDLDIAIISEVHFEAAWRDLRRAAQPTVGELDRDLVAILNWQRKRFFDGAIIATKLLPYLSFGPDWISAKARIAERVALMLDREVELNYWIYRDYWSMRNYVANGIIRCKRELAAL